MNSKIRGVWLRYELAGQEHQLGILPRTLYENPLDNNDLRRRLNLNLLEYETLMENLKRIDKNTKRPRKDELSIIEKRGLDPEKDYFEITINLKTKKLQETRII